MVGTGSGTIEGPEHGKGGQEPLSAQRQDKFLGQRENQSELSLHSQQQPKLWPQSDEEPLQHLWKTMSRETEWSHYLH